MSQNCSIHFHGHFRPKRKPLLHSSFVGANNLGVDTPKTLRVAANQSALATIDNYPLRLAAMHRNTVPHPAPLWKEAKVSPNDSTGHLRFTGGHHRNPSVELLSSGS